MSTESDRSKFGRLASPITPLSTRGKLPENVPGLPEGTMTRTEYTRLVEPDPKLVTQLEQVLEGFRQKVAGTHKPPGPEFIPRYQDGPIWLLRRRIPQKHLSSGVFSGVEVAFFETAEGRREANLIPFVWIDLRKDGTRIQPSIPPESIRRLEILFSPADYSDWFRRFQQELDAAWSTSQTWAKDPGKYATEHRPRLAQKKLQT